MVQQFSSLSAPEEVMTATHGSTNGDRGLSVNIGLVYDNKSIRQVCLFAAQTSSEIQKRKQLHYFNISHDFSSCFYSSLRIVNLITLKCRDS